MTHPSHQLVRDFFTQLATGTISDELLCDDITFWSVNSGLSDTARFKAGIRALNAIVDGQISYEIESITAEEDRAVAVINSHGTLINGDKSANNHVFVMYLRDGRVAHVKEFMNVDVVREKIAPLLQQVMAAAQQ